jgi:hypothetical protein
VKPVYRHDCSTCTFVQNLTVDGTIYDVYRCAGPLTSTWIARYNDEGPGYWSMPWEVLRTIPKDNDSTKLLKEMQRIAEEYENE